MQSNKFSDFLHCRQSLHLAWLVLLFTAGIILGTTLGAEDSAIYFALMRRGLVTPVSIVGVVVCTFLPFLFTAAALFSGHLWLIYLQAFCKGFAVAFVAMLCLACFGSGGWLVRLLLLFSQLAALPALWFVWLRYGCAQKAGLCGMVSVACYLFVVSLTDGYLVAPFLGQLF